MKKNDFDLARNCRECEKILPLEPRPIIQGSSKSKICIIGQAPGLAAHNTNLPWNDASGDRLRAWIGMPKTTFYDENTVAILPMGFCYPGKAASGDLPPIKQCAEIWHQRLLSAFSPKLTLLIGQYAQNYYLKDKSNVTNRVKNWQRYLPKYIVLPHPSPRNNIWLKKNEWFEQSVLPQIKSRIQTACHS
ncbi:uracil-DNA glycosylase family protein [Aliiglaciecola sp. 3_MG-2023]|uniref:uracil-DNA glycosylase family protein n=1 Tax=Aliiglaciecola sp. 3_MG-2023 TaxID=3062644 RepID=UPI0026E372A9|nr:uracil-DNA glycosylase family protein [Aliiglaciecola sp. 3_MG-2023]MDO6692138.1 uracil-DNA glycosylase family protein [Aliiglaciecola sp. 3_MG-2023]